MSKRTPNIPSRARAMKHWAGERRAFYLPITDILSSSSTDGELVIRLQYRRGDITEGTLHYGDKVLNFDGHDVVYAERVKRAVRTHLRSNLEFFAINRDAFHSEWSDTRINPTPWLWDRDMFTSGITDDLVGDISETRPAAYAGEQEVVGLKVEARITGQLADGLHEWSIDGVSKNHDTPNLSRFPVKESKSAVKSMVSDENVPDDAPALKGKHGRSPRTERTLDWYFKRYQFPIVLTKSASDDRVVEILQGGPCTRKVKLRNGTNALVTTFGANDRLWTGTLENGTTIVWDEWGRLNSCADDFVRRDDDSRDIILPPPFPPKTILDFIVGGAYPMAVGGNPADAGKTVVTSRSGTKYLILAIRNERIIGVNVETDKLYRWNKDGLCITNNIGGDSTSLALKLPDSVNANDFEDEEEPTTGFGKRERFAKLSDDD